MGSAGLHQGFGESLKRPWEEFVTEFLEKKASRHPLPTQVAYRMCINSFTRTAKPERLGDVTVPKLDEFVVARLQDGVAAATVNKELRHLRAVMKWAKLRHYIPTSPDFSGLYVRIDAKQPTTIPEDDFMSMVMALRKRSLELVHRPASWWKIFLYVAHYLGLRRGEILGLEWGQVSFATLEVTVTAETSKGRKDRVLPMSVELLTLLAQWKKLQKKVLATDKVLPWPCRTWRQLYNDWHAIQTAAGIPEGEHYVPKNCRSSCASELIASGVPTAVVKDFLGHASVTTTEKYYINTRPELRTAANARKVKLA